MLLHVDIVLAIPFCGLSIYVHVYRHLRGSVATCHMYTSMDVYVSCMPRVPKHIIRVSISYFTTFTTPLCYNVYNHSSGFKVTTVTTPTFTTHGLRFRSGNAVFTSFSSISKVYYISCKCGQYYWACNLVIYTLVLKSLA